MRRLALNERDRSEAIVVLEARLPPMPQHAGVVRYETLAGALARVDGRVAGAFDREHRELALDVSPQERELVLEVERRSLPTNGLPPGPGVRWWLMNRLAAAQPRRQATLAFDTDTGDTEPSAAAAATADPLPLWGHSHLDVAWLWTYDATRRKAMRTFANAVALLENDASFEFMQSQPQLYEFVRDGDPEFFARVVRLVRVGRFDADVAAMWVEPDCNIPSGESLLRQLLAAHRFCTQAFGVEPSIAWLPDTFGFARTLPTLLAHAGIAYFATTKLQWNDTTRFPYPQFRWRGPDGAEVVAASMDRMEGGCEAPRVRVARERGEPLIVGYGDGGGGPTAAQLRDARGVGRWERPRAYFERLEARRDTLPVHDDELYLQYHRGVYTTHHDMKSQNAALERSLARAEEQAAWCVAVRAPAEALVRVRAALNEAWRVVLRNQFHDVLPGTSVAEVHADARREYAHAVELVNGAFAATRAMLPRGARPLRERALYEPRERDGAFVFENALLRARVLCSGAIVELAVRGGANVVATQANLLKLYRDRPTKWEAWNVDAGYERGEVAVSSQPATVADGALNVPFDIGGSRATMRLSLAAGEPFLRVDLAVDWRERRRLLRTESELALVADDVAYGAPHGVVIRSARTDTAERRAQYEVPGQRFAFVRDDARGFGLACFALDTYGWNGRRALASSGDGGVHLGHSLLRGTTWPDPLADVGEHRLSWAYAPTENWSYGAIERAWQRFAAEPSVPLFDSDDEAVLVVATKPAEDGDGVILRLRECNGVARSVRIRCGGRMREVQPVDALERPCEGSVTIERESIVAGIGAYGLRSFRVGFS
jgi:alpha-mannosidase